MASEPARPTWRTWLFWALFLLLVVAIYGATAGHRHGRTVLFSQLLDEIESGRVEHLRVWLLGDDAADFQATLREGGGTLRARGVFSNQVLQRLTEQAVPIEVDTAWLRGARDLLPWIPAVLVVAVLALLLRQAAGGGGTNVEKLKQSSPRRLDRVEPKTTFADVAGLAGPVAELRGLLELLRQHPTLRPRGVALPRAVLLTGPPGCGKTLLARALAGEAQIPCLEASGPEFIEMFVGVGAARLRHLFEEARKLAPCVIVLDHLDAVGRRREGGASDRREDEREQTLHQFLAALEGMGGKGPEFLVLATSNRPELLDPALLRPGRFDRVIELPRPDRDARRAILAHHARGRSLEADADLDAQAAATEGWSGAELAALLGEAALAAARRAGPLPAGAAPRIAGADLEAARAVVERVRAAAAAAAPG